MPTTPRKRGAPFGNRNALKHGYYAHTYRPAETRTKADCPPPDSLADEIALLRVLIRRVVEKTTGDESMAESLEILRIVSMATSALARLQRAQHLVRGGPGDEIQQALEEALATVSTELGLAPEPDPRQHSSRISDLGSPITCPPQLTPIVFAANNSPRNTSAPDADHPSPITVSGSPISSPPELTPIVFSEDNSSRSPAVSRPRQTRKRHRPTRTAPHPASPISSS